MNVTIHEVELAPLYTGRPKRGSRQRRAASSFRQCRIFHRGAVGRPSSRCKLTMVL